MIELKYIVRKFILLAALLVIGYSYAHAQNTGAAPYLDSYHDYEVKFGKAGNLKRWVLTDRDDETGSNTYTFTNGVGNGQWFTFPVGATAGHQRVKILFRRDVFTPAPTEVLIVNWRLRYYEYEDIHGDGSLVCISAREFPITVSENTFHLLVGNDFSKCNDENGKVHTYSEVDNDPAGSDLFSTVVTYTVTMKKSADYLPNSFSFNSNFNQTPINFAVAVTTDGGGAATYSLTDETYTINVTRPGGGVDPFPDEVEVTLSVTFRNPVLAETIPELTVSNGQAVVNGSPDAITFDNETIYPVDPANPGDRTQAVTLYALPATRNITHGAGETASSAQNPMQNSTHNYTVQMGNFDNRSNGSTAWRIEKAGIVVVPGLTTYTITPTFSSPNALASITFNFEHDAVVPENNNYILYFTEQSSNNCTTQREYPFIIQPKFDVDIVALSNTCATFSGQVNNTPLVTTATTVNYVVDLITVGYEFTWQFDFVISCTELADELTISNIVVTGGTPATFVAGTNTGTVTVTKEDGTPVSRKVTLSVTYYSLYEIEHDITLALDKITGSFSEEDADAINRTVHTIYRMPQAGVLAGVE